MNKEDFVKMADWIASIVEGSYYINTAKWEYDGLLLNSEDLYELYLVSEEYEKQIYWYKEKPYTIIKESKVKLEGKWHDAIIYQCEYTNPDGKIWIRLKGEFFNLFKTKN